MRIWDSVTLQTLRTVGMGDANANFDRGVQCCAFGRAAGGILLAVVDDSYEHVLSIWEWQSGKKLAEAKVAYFVNQLIRWTNNRKSNLTFSTQFTPFGKYFATNIVPLLNYFAFPPLRRL